MQLHIGRIQRGSTTDKHGVAACARGSDVAKLRGCIACYAQQRATTSKLADDSAEQHAPHHSCAVYLDAPVVLPDWPSWAADTKGIDLDTSACASKMQKTAFL